jgi:hypothetical protein
MAYPILFCAAKPDAPGNETIDSFNNHIDSFVALREGIGYVNLDSL